MSTLNASENLVVYRNRAKYIKQPDGNLRLVAIQSFSEPRFRSSGWEVSEKMDSQLDIVDDSDDVIDDSDADGSSAANIERASRRAKINAFDMILCNHDLDSFATFTYRPDDCLDRSSYDDCYKSLSVWLSNRVQRRGLKYVIVPEHHKSGDIHFHGILNSSALKYEQAVSPRTGRALTRNGLPIYNLTDWKAGFSTLQIIGQSESDRDKVAKYIFKYMGKQVGQKIGGRYALIGGDMNKPVYRYSNIGGAEFFISDNVVVHERTVTVSDSLTYRELTFV